MTSWILFAVLFFSDGNSGYIGPFVSPDENTCRKRQMIIENHIEIRATRVKNLYTWKSWCLSVNLGSDV